jgi:hypothetical protein
MNKDHHQLTKLVALDVSHPLIFWLKEVALKNIDLYMMNEAAKQMSVMESQKINSIGK